MRAAILKGPRQLSIENREAPKVGSHDVLIRIRATAICGTDIEIYKGKGGGKFPMVPGHEFAGEVEKVGSHVINIRPGDRVVGGPAISCGKCFSCKKGLQNLCSNGGLIGREKDGAFAEYVSIPESNAHKIPNDVSFEEATIITTLTTVLHSHRLVDIFPESSVAIMGCGFTGLLNVQLAKLRGARPIIAVSRSQWKLDLAEKLGADVILRSGDEGVLSRVKSLTDGRGADLAIETVGSATTLRECVDLVGPGGKVLFFGITSDKAEDLSLFPIHFKELSIIASRAMLPKDWEPSIQMVATGRIDVKPLITQKIPFEELQNGFDMFEDRDIQSIRIIVTQ
jgi:L-iditol 2-dehydrogenase